MWPLPLVLVQRDFGWSGPLFQRPIGFNCPVATDYRFSRALLLRSLGTLLVLAGLVVLLVGVLVGVLDLPTAVLSVTVVLAVLLVVGAAVVATRLTSLVRFDETGYRVRWLRGAGVKQGRWRDVEDAVTTTIAGHDCIVLRLRDGRTTTIPVKVLDASPTAFIEDLTGRLDKGHGYRRLR